MEIISVLGNTSVILQLALYMKPVWHMKNLAVRPILILRRIRILIFRLFMQCSSHIPYLPSSQFRRFYSMVKASGEKISCGIRINPEYSEVEVELYNPCAPGTRFGVTADLLPETLPEGIEGFHCHCHCESSSYELEHTLQHIEETFARWFPQIKWLNLGGGHLMTRKDYDTEHLISLLKGLKARYPHLEIILEPGSAFTWQTGPLVASVVDIVENRGIKNCDSGC